MKRITLPLLVAVASIGMASGAITVTSWSYQTLTTASSLAPQSGATTVAAFDMGGGSTSSLGGVSFAAAPYQQIASSNGVSIAYSVPGVYWAGTATGGYAANTVLDSFQLSYPENTGLVEILSGLNEGQQYTIQFILADSRTGGVDGRMAEIVGGANAGADVTGTSNKLRFAYQGQEQYAVISATFTADASGRAAFYPRIYAADGTTALGTQLNALHIMAVPEPSIALLGGVGLLCLMRRKRD